MVSQFSPPVEAPPLPGLLLKYRESSIGCLRLTHVTWRGQIQQPPDVTLKVDALGKEASQRWLSEQCPRMRLPDDNVDSGIVRR